MDVSQVNIRIRITTPDGRIFNHEFRTLVTANQAGLTRATLENTISWNTCIHIVMNQDGNITASICSDSESSEANEDIEYDSDESDL